MLVTPADVAPKAAFVSLSLRLRETPTYVYPGATHALRCHATKTATAAMWKPVSNNNANDNNQSQKRSSAFPAKAIGIVARPLFDASRMQESVDASLSAKATTPARPATFAKQGDQANPSDVNPRRMFAPFPVDKTKTAQRNGPARTNNAFRQEKAAKTKAAIYAPARPA